MLDSRDLKILQILQENADTSVGRIAECVHISPSACSRRIARLREEGYVNRTVALLDRERLHLGTTVYVILQARHEPEWLESFREAVGAIAEILECHRLAGNFDYLLKLVVADVAHYDRVYKQLITAVEPHDVSAYISMETIKDDQTLPIKML